MNKEELEKMFDEMFDRLSYEDFKSYVFESIIPEVLKSLIPNSYVKARNEYGEMFFTSKEILEIIKQKAKEIYNIDL